MPPNVPPNTPKNTQPPTPPQYIYQVTHIPLLALDGRVSCDMAPVKGYKPADDERGAWRALQFNESRRGFLVSRLLVKE